MAKVRINKPKKIKLAEPEPRRPDPIFAPVVAAFEKDKSVTAGFMMSSFRLKVNGKIFAMYGRGQFVVKLPKSRVDQIVERGDGQRFDPGHGRLMKEWVVIETKQKTWLNIANEAYAYVKSVKAK